MAAKNLINLERVTKAFDIKPLLTDLSIGINEGERIGIVGRNGGGKSTLLKVMAGLEPVDQGRVSVANGAKIGVLSQVDVSSAETTVREFILANKPTHEWASDKSIREIFKGLFGGVSDEFFARNFMSLSGGERRRVSLAKLLIEDLDLLLLDEPTNHLDVEGIDWLANHLKSRQGLAIAVITHDRWFLDEISEQMWEVVDGEILTYEGGYSAYVLSKAERQRQLEVEAGKRNALIRKELAWLRRGAPARTSKPKFRIEAANQLISDEPAPRNNAELLNFAENRLGRTVYELHHAEIAIGEKTILESCTWSIGPWYRIGIVGVNGSGKSTLLRTLIGQLKPTKGKLTTGLTVSPAHLSQHLEEIDPTWRVLEAVERVAHFVQLGNGKELSASQLCERLGFGADSQWTPVADLSGGERRRLQLTRLLMDSPNVLLLDEPTNDFDVETLTALEDLLDSFGGTLIVVSHDRYFLERVCDKFVALFDDRALHDLPGGIDQYLRQLKTREVEESVVRTDRGVSPAVRLREARKEMARVNRQLEKLHAEQSRLQMEQEDHISNHEKLVAIMEELSALSETADAIEETWLKLSIEIESLERTEQGN